MNLACFEQTVQNGLARKYPSYSLRRECCRVAAMQATWSRHLTQLTELPFSAAITTESWGEAERDDQKTKKPRSLF